VLEAGGYTFRRFNEETLREFSDWKAARSAWAKQAAAAQKPACKNLGHAGPEI
jgi:hypothetical protein